MRHKRKQNIKESRIRVKELCNELLRQCQKSPEASSIVDYFRRLKSVTDTIANFQKNLSIVESIFNGDREAKLKSLERRYKDYFECKISIQNSESAGFGLRVEEPIKKNTRLLHVPAEHMLYIRNLTTQLPNFLESDPIFCGMNNVALSMATLHELSLGEKSKFKEYISSLPSTYSTVAYLSVDDFSVIDGFPAAELISNTYRNICRQYAYFYLLFDRMEGETVLPNYMKSFCFKDYQWAISTVMSRNNMIPENEGEVLCLIPLWDMINHKQGQMTTDFDPASRSLLFYATESYEKGDEIFMDYGRRTSTEFLLYSGFVPEVNRFHKVPIKLGLSKYDKLLTLRTRVLEKLKLSSEISVPVPSQDGSSLPDDFVVFSRVFVMSESELQCALEADESANNLLSNVFSDSRIDNAARKFIEDRLNCLVRVYESRLERNLKSVQVKGPLHEQCARLCRQDIATLSRCLSTFVQISH
nr:SET domain containing protein 3 [Hymenolepis microstoma]